MERQGVTHYAAKVPNVASAIDLAVAIEQFAIPARLWDADSIAMARLGREVEYQNEEVVPVIRSSTEGEDTLIGIAKVDPFKPLGFEIELVKSWLLAIESVRVGDKAADRAVHWPLEQIPFDRATFVPFIPLPDFTAHEQQLLARMSHLVAKQESQVGELLPPVPGHTRKQCAFSVNHFIVGQRQHEVFAIGVELRKGQHALVIFPVLRIFPDVKQRIVHPAKIPFD